LRCSCRTTAVDFFLWLLAQTDVYAFGVTMYETLTASRAWEGARRSAIRAAVVGGERPPLPLTMDVDMQRLVAQCWSANPRHRPSVADVIAALEAVEAAIPARQESTSVVWRENRSPFRLVPSNFGHWSRVQLSTESHISVCQWHVAVDSVPAAVAEVGRSVLALVDAVGVACEGLLARVEVERMEVLRTVEDAVVSFVHKVWRRVSTSLAVRCGAAVTAVCVMCRSRSCRCETAPRRRLCSL
jgi:hypothetical protein